MSLMTATATAAAENRKKYDVILLDIEGTTTPISFVHSTLFPYVSAHLEEYLRQHYYEEQTKEDIRDIIKLAQQDQQQGLSVVSIPQGPICIDPKAESELETSTSSPAFNDQFSALISNIRDQMKLDRKSFALKQLQGHMWKVGYESGELQGFIYDDVVEEMKKWKSDFKLNISIYSSGSIEAQKLIFHYTNHGSLLHLISHHFDTGVGMKQDFHSYQAIIQQLGITPNRLLFCTDVLGEAQAAIKAGAAAVIVVREGNPPVPENCGIRKVHTFRDIDILHTTDYENQ